MPAQKIKTIWALSSGMTTNLLPCSHPAVQWSLKKALNSGAKAAAATSLILRQMQRITHCHNYTTTAQASLCWCSRWHSPSCTLTWQMLLLHILQNPVNHLSVSLLHKGTELVHMLQTGRGHLVTLAQSTVKGSILFEKQGETNVGSMAPTFTRPKT